MVRYVLRYTLAISAFFCYLAVPAPRPIHRECPTLKPPITAASLLCGPLQTPIRYGSRDTPAVTRLAPAVIPIKEVKTDVSASCANTPFVLSFVFIFALAVSMKRVLAIHGHSQCAHSFRLKLSAIEDACQDAIEFVFVDAPHVLMPVDLPGASATGASTAITINGQPARAWWRFLWDMSDVSTALESFKYIRNVLETQGPFDGILGFSQGAAFAAMITAHLENPSMEGSLFQGINHPPLQFAVLISGFYAPWWAVPLPHKIRTPSLHIFGIHDIMVSPENMARLTAYFEAPRVEIHQGGHFIPRTLTWRRFLADYLSSRTRGTGAAARSPTPPLCREEFFSIQRTVEVGS